MDEIDKKTKRRMKKQKIYRKIIDESVSEIHSRVSTQASERVIE